MCLRACIPSAYQKLRTTPEDKLATAMEKLRTASGHLQKRIAHLETRKSDHERNLVDLEVKRRKASSLDTNNIRRLKAELRRRRICELSIQKFDALNGHLEQQIAGLEDSTAMSAALSALRSGAKVGKKHAEILEKIDVEKIMDDFSENNDIMVSIQKALDTTSDWMDTMDDDKALEELERLIDQEQVQTKFVAQDEEHVLQGLPGVPKQDPVNTDEVVSDEEVFLGMQAL